MDKGTRTADEIAVASALVIFKKGFAKEVMRGATMIRVRCSKCGRPNPYDTNKCVHCGVILKKVVDKTMADMGPDPSYHAYLRYYPKESGERIARALFQ